MSRVEEVKTLLAREPLPEDSEWSALAMKFAALIDYWAHAQNEPESNWDRDFRAAVSGLGAEAMLETGVLDQAAWVADEMQRIRKATRASELELPP